MEEPVPLLSPRPEHDSRIPTSDLSTKDLNDPGIMLQTRQKSEAQDNSLDFNSPQPPAPASAAQDLSVSHEGLKKLLVMTMDLQDADSISPVSDSSINDLMQSMPDSPLWEGPLVLMPSNSPVVVLKMPRFEVSKHSTDRRWDFQAPLSKVSNGASIYPIIENAISGHAVTLGTAPKLPFLDGPAIDIVATTTKDFAHNLANCSPIPGAPIAGNILPLNAVKDLPAATTSLPLDDVAAVPGVPELPTGPGLSDASGIPNGPGLPSLPTIPSVPGLLVDATGLASTPPAPAPNLTRKQKAKAKGLKCIRKSRRIFLRKPVLSAVLGRQLAGPTKDVLRLISMGVLPEEAVGCIMGNATCAVPAPVPAPLPVPV